MKLFFRLIVILVIGMLLQPNVKGQGASAALNGVILKLFGKHDNFAVDSEFQLLDEKQKPAITLTLSIAVSEGKMRADADMNAAKGPGIYPEDIAQARKAGLDRIISLIRQDKGKIYIVYPTRRSYEEAALPKELASGGGIAKIQKTPLGKETIDGHLCVKNRVVLLDARNNKQEMVSWEASDMKDFPLMVKLSDSGQSWVVHNRNIRFGKIDVASFEVPSGFAKLQQPKQ